MNDKSKLLKGRRRWLLGSLGAVAAGATVAAATANAASSASPAATGFVPTRHAEDAWLDVVTSSHRVFLDSSTTNGGATAMNYASNILLGHASGYGGSESDYALVICFRHQSTPFGYSDAIWAKYGESLSGSMRFPDPRTEEPFAVNPLNIAGRTDFPSRGFTLDAMGARGVRFAICNRATLNLSRRLARVTGGTADDIYQEIVASIVPNGRMVPAGVVAATRAQEYGYSLLYSA